MGQRFTFPVDKHVEGDTLKGFKEFDLYHDGSGRVLRLTRLSDDCISDTISDGQLLVWKSDGTATNDFSAGIALDLQVRPAGIALGTIAESSAVGDTSAGQKYIWLLIKGYHSAVVTNGDDDIAIGDTLVPDPAAGTDGSVNSFVPGGTFTAADMDILTCGVVGFAVAADVDGSNTVEAFIDIR